MAKMPYCPWLVQWSKARGPRGGMDQRSSRVARRLRLTRQRARIPPTGPTARKIAPEGRKTQRTHRHDQGRLSPSIGAGVLGARDSRLEARDISIASWI